MGSSFTNIQIRNTTTSAVCKLIQSLSASRAYVSKPKNGWLTLYTEETEDRNQEKKLKKLAKAISKSLKTDVFAFLVYDSGIAMYWLYQCGSLIDAFDSCPDYFDDEVGDQPCKRVGGKTELILPMCKPGTTHAQLEAVLHPEEDPTFAEDILVAFGKLLGLDEMRLTLGFEYFEHEGEQILDDIGEFEPIGQGAERKQSRVIPSNKESPPVNPVIEFTSIVTMMAGVRSDLASKQFQQFQIMASMLWSKGKASKLKKQMLEAADKAVEDSLKRCRMTNCPSFEEMKAAIENGYDSYAKFLSQRTPDCLIEIGVEAVRGQMVEFVSALLRSGLDPNVPNAFGQTMLQAAERCGAGTEIYKIVKASASK